MLQLGEKENNTFNLKCLQTWTNRQKVSDVVRGMQTYRDLYSHLPANVFLLWSTETFWQKCLLSLCVRYVVTLLYKAVIPPVSLYLCSIKLPSHTDTSLHLLLPPPSLPSASSADDRFDTLIWAAWKSLEMSPPSLQVSPSLPPPSLIYTFIDIKTPLICSEVVCTSYFLHVS